MMGTISFHNADVSVNLNDRKKLKQFLPGIFSLYSLNLFSLDYIFCSDKYLLGINRQFLHHDFYTDIITFDLSDTKNTMIGEVYISIERVRENALTLRFPVKQELHRIIFHGALHLCGFKDKSQKDKLAMRIAEDFWLSTYFS